MQKENQKQIVARIIFVVLMMLIFNAVFSSVSQAANLTYTMTEKLPGFETETLSDLPTLLQSIYKFSIWVVGICALFMITIGGFTYMTSAGNTATAGTGKKMIRDAIIGLVLVLTAALLFTVINPSITTVNLQVTPVPASTTTPAATTTTPAATTP